MSKVTGNYNLIMPELNDSPPDITAMNPNWQKIDTKLKEQEEKITDTVSLVSIRPAMTTADITYYVNASTGNDNNNGLTSGTAFKTIQKAISLIPQVVNHGITINVAAGTYNESVAIRGFTGSGVLRVNGDTVVSTSRTIVALTIDGCSCYVGVTGFNITTTSTPGVSASRCQDVTLNYVNVVSAVTAQPGVYAWASLIRLMNCVISNRARAVEIGFNSLVQSTANSGSGNTVGLSVAGASVLAKSGTQPTGTTPEYVGLGGLIVDTNGIPSGVLPLTGGTMSGSLSIDMNFPAIILRDSVSGLSGRIFETGGYTYIRTYKNESEYTQLALGQHSQSAHDLLQLYKLGGNICRVYHEGNITISTAAPGSALTEGAQHQVY
jgi:hypothetical protein